MTPFYDLSILIPARNEEFLNRTIEDVLAHTSDRTEIIVYLDGVWDDVPLHPRVTIVFSEQSIGQRAATNQACRLSQARYVCKLDAHCAIDDGFDDKMIAEMRQDDWTLVPRMYNLHVFDRVCVTCGHRMYQGPLEAGCEQCKGELRKDIVWKRRERRVSDHMCFDRQMKFGYFHAYGKRPVAQGDVVETMSLLGACFMLTRQRYWQLNICDEAHNASGWGQQAAEVACKSWLSGGALMVNKKTWFAHMFRTQGGTFGFPYVLPGRDVERARQYSRDLWLKDQWPMAARPLSWLVEKFAPVPGWHDAPAKGIVYYTDSRLDEKIAADCRDQLAKAGLPIVSVSLQPLDFGQNIVLSRERGHLTMFKQILAGLEAITAEIVFLCEHDVLYHPSHFEFDPPKQDVFYYNLNVWKYDPLGHRAVSYDCKQTSGLCAYRDVLIEHYRKRVALVEAHGFSRKMGFEPGSHRRPERVDDYASDIWRSVGPNVDIRHGKNLTQTRWRQADFRDQRHCQNWREASSVPGWDVVLGVAQA